MQLRPYPERTDGKKVQLTDEEITRLLNNADGTEQSIAIGLAARCGLRVAEVVDVTPPDIAETNAGPRVRIWNGKGNKYRESPIPRDLVSRIEAYSEIRAADASVPLVDKTTRTVERWVSHAADRCRSDDSDDGWSYLSPHDLRASWGHLLIESGVEPGLIMEWGGWEDWDTFREHYLGVYTPNMQRDELEKVSWL